MHNRTEHMVGVKLSRQIESTTSKWIFGYLAFVGDKCVNYHRKRIKAFNATQFKPVGIRRRLFCVGHIEFRRKNAFNFWHVPWTAFFPSHSLNIAIKAHLLLNYDRLIYSVVCAPEYGDAGYQSPIRIMNWSLRVCCYTFVESMPLTSHFRWECSGWSCRPKPKATNSDCLARGRAGGFRTDYGCLAAT